MLYSNFYFCSLNFQHGITRRKSRITNITYLKKRSLVAEWRRRSVYHFSGYPGQMHKNRNWRPTEVTFILYTDAWGYENYWELTPADSACGSATILFDGNGDVGCSRYIQENASICRFWTSWIFNINVYRVRFWLFNCPRLA